MERETRIFGLTRKQYSAMRARFRKASRFRIFQLEASGDLGKWTLAQLARAQSHEVGTPYPSFEKLKAEFDPDRRHHPGLEQSEKRPGVGTQLGGPPIPTKSPTPPTGQGR